MCRKIIFYDYIKDLLKSNFNEDEDYIIESKNINGKGKGKGGNNKKIVMLTYTCAKILCMISKTPKANIIRKFYIDLEKLIITYKDSIVKDLNNQLKFQIRKLLIKIKKKD